MRRLPIVTVGLAALLIGIAGAWYSVRQDRELRRLIAAGDAALAQDDTYGAIEAFSGALALNETSMLAHLRRGDAYRRRGEFTSALRDLRRAQSLDPTAPAPAERAGDVNLAMGRLTLAIADYTAFLELDDRSPRVLYKLGLAHYRNRQCADAVTPLRAAIAQDARLAEAHYLLAVCLRESGAQGDALTALTRALSLSPTLTPVREELVDVYDAMGRRREALEQLEALAALEPERASRLIDVGLAYAAWGRTEAAILTLDRAADRYPGDPAVAVAIGRVWIDVAERLDDPDAARRALTALTPIAGSSTDARVLYGRAQLLADQVRAAEHTLVEATRELPIDPLAFRYLADASERLGHLAAAHDALTRYVALVGDYDAPQASIDRLEELAQRLGTGRRRVSPAVRASDPR